MLKRDEETPKGTTAVWWIRMLAYVGLGAFVSIGLGKLAHYADDKTKDVGRVDGCSAVYANYVGKLPKGTLILSMEDGSLVVIGCKQEGGPAAPLSEKADAEVRRCLEEAQSGSAVE